MGLVNFSGIASGIDSQSLISALLDQERTTRIKPLETKISTLSGTNSAFGDLSDLLGSLQTAATKLRTLNGGGVSKRATSSDETALGASVANSAASGSYTVTVSALAKNATASFDDHYASADTAINSSINDGATAADRTVTVTVGSGSSQESVAVVVGSTTTLNQFVTDFNSQSTKATASVVNTGTSSAPAYAIVFNSNEQGLDEGQLAISVGSEIQTAGSGAFTSNTLSQATDAQFSISGISGTITRSSNSVSDVLPGVTLSLNNTGSSTLNIGTDKAATTKTLQEFVDAYNEIVNYISDNDTVTRDESGDTVTNVFGTLANTSLDNNLLSALRSALSSSSTSGGAVNVLADLGITTQRDGTLAFDEDTLSDALASDPGAVQTITQNLGDTLASVDGTIAQFTRYGGLIDTARNANDSAITSYEKRKEEIENQLTKKKETLTAQYARLESLIGQLNSQQQQLGSLLPR